MTPDSSPVEQEEHQRILARVWQLWEFFKDRAPVPVTLLQPQIKGLGLTSVPHCRTGTQPLSSDRFFLYRKSSDLALGTTDPRPKDQQREDDALISCSFYICQELDEQGKECASSPLELQVAGSVPALAWPPAPVTCLFFNGLKIQWEA